MSLEKSYNKTLSLMASKLSIQNDIILKKSDELLRLLQIKMLNSKLNQLNEYSKAIICLDLAASIIGVATDFDAQLKLSGLKKSLYINNRNIVRKLLNIDQNISIKDICVQFGCMSIADEAQKLLDKYKQSDKLGTKDFDHPQYSCVSVYTICRLLKIKVQKSKLIELSRLKSTHWNQLETEFMKFAESNNIDNKTKYKSNKKNKNEFLDIIDSYSGKNTEHIQIEQSDNIQEDYETWRARILANAFSNINE